MALKEEKIGWAFNKFDEIVHISQASSGANGYYCLGCKKEMMAKKGQIRLHHFSHLATYNGKGGCLLTDDNARLMVAKEVLQRQKVFTLPPFYTRQKGKSVKISGSETLHLADALVEPRLVIEKDQLNWYRNSSPIKNDYLLSPSSVLLCLDGREYVLYLVPRLPNKLDLADIQSAIIFAKMPAIIKVIPSVNSFYELENIFKSFKQTYWLYYEGGSTHNMDSGTIAGRSEEFAEGEQYLLPYAETVSCRKFRIREAIRWLMECMGSRNFKEAESEISERVREEKQRTERDLRGAQEAIQPAIKHTENQLKDKERYFNRFMEEERRVIEEEGRIIKEIESRLRDRNTAALEEAQRRLDNSRVKGELNLNSVKERERRAIEELRKEEDRVKAEEGRIFREKERVTREIGNVDQQLQGTFKEGSLIINDVEAASRKLAEIEGEIDKINSDARKLYFLSYEAEERRNNKRRK